AARGALAIAVAEVAETPCVTGAVEQLRVFEGDLARLPRRDRENAGADEALPGELDQRRIAFLAHDGFVNRARLCGVHRLPTQLLVALPQRVAREHGLARQREVVHPFVHHRAVIAEPFLDGDAIHAPGTADLHGDARTTDSPIGRPRNGSTGRDLPRGTRGRRG